MDKLEFNYHKIPARKGLLDFLKERGEKDILKKIGENPKAWLEELSLIIHAVTSNPLVCGIGLFTPQLEDPSFQKIGNNIYFYDGTDNRLEGLWIRGNFDAETAELIGKDCEWSKYRTKLNASLRINKEFADISPEEFLPENFEQKGKRLEDAKKRPVWKIKIGEREIYAKSSEIITSQYFKHTKPSYRLTNFHSIQKATSKREMEITKRLADFGVNVPPIFGYYESSFEDFLFVGEIKGRQPSEFLDTRRQEIIKQDAKMLANLCRAGYRKGYFEDFDDKIFDGKKLWLIDVDECSDLYCFLNIDFREILLDPLQRNNVRKLRRLQESVFNATLKDNIYACKDTLIPTDEDKEFYVKSFYQTLKWKIPNPRKMQDFLTFPEDYQTADRNFSMMNDSD